jgi:tyrosinase
MAKKTSPVMATGLKVRRSILELQHAYEAGDVKPLSNLVRAWLGIQSLSPQDLRSFFNLGGYHGEPFNGAGASDGSYWGGYCNHGNILFPTWHRVYLLKLEEALQSIPGCQDVMLPYWDQTDAHTLNYGIPSVLTDEFFLLDGVRKVKNPLRSFILPVDLSDDVAADADAYSKPRGYETVRYPLSGLVGTEEAREKTRIHNEQFPDPIENTKILNGNVMDWLKMDFVPNVTRPADTHQAYIDCLEAPNFTVFSNTASSGHWNNTKSTKDAMVVSLETPHNSIHLAVGGFDVGDAHLSPIPGANGDMGENNTAGFDPIFYFHHCNIDRVFWLWQRRHKSTDMLEIIPEYPGTNSSDTDGGPPTGIEKNIFLTMETNLIPFRHADNRYYRSSDCFNIERQLGYTYSVGSLDTDKRPKQTTRTPGKLIRITGVNRGAIRGSFIIAAFAEIDGKKYRIGTEAILSRWNTKSCANCQKNLEARAFFEEPEIATRSLTPIKYEVKILGREGIIAEGDGSYSTRDLMSTPKFILAVR